MGGGNRVLRLNLLFGPRIEDQANDSESFARESDPRIYGQPELSDLQI